MQVSALILTYNEEINIARCLASLKGCDDIVVIDSGSTDATCRIACELGARVLTRPFDNFASQRNFGLNEGGLRHQWVLHLDADEELTAEFREQLSRLEPESPLLGYRVPSKTMLNGKWLRNSGMYPSYQVRLTHRDELRFIQVGHGQREDTTPDKIGTFDEPYLHYNFSHGIASWFRKHIQYAEQEANEAKKRKASVDVTSVKNGGSTGRRRALKQFASSLPVWLRPPLRFIYIFILRRGFLDGRSGLQYALMLVVYETMISAFEVNNATKEE